MYDLISVIMSTYNEDLKWIEKSIDSILEQSYINIEFIIILDNPQNIPLKKMLEDYSRKDNRICLIINNKNMGLVKSLNIALKHCRGKYIARMDADDISEKERLKYQKEYLEKNDLDFVFSGIDVINEQGAKLFETNKKELKSHQIKKLLEITNATYHPTWFLKAEIYERLGGYREALYCEDYDFSLRCLSKGYRLGKMDQNILRYRVRENSISRSYSLEQFLNSKGILKLYKQNELEDFESVRKVIDNSKKVANAKEKEKYTKADRKSNDAINLIKNHKKLKGIVEVAKSILISKYYSLKYIDILKYKIISFNL